MTIRETLIKNGVKNLREFGYPSCDENNIMKVEIFKAFFEAMLEENLGKGFDKDINALLKELQ
jgi:hypothetical protein